MPISKPDFNLIFASQAPSQDLPAAFNNYARGWDEARKNNGKPTIKQFNYLIQQLDLKALWMIQNGAALPFDETMDYAEGAFTVKDGSLQQFVSGVWKKPTQTADQIFDESGKTQQEINDEQAYRNAQSVYLADYLRKMNVLPTDDISSVLNQIKSDGVKKLYVNSGTYKVNSVINFTSDFEFENESGVVFDFGNTGGFTATGSISDLGLITSNISKGVSNSLTLADTSGISVGDWLAISNPVDYSFSPYRAYYRSGEYVEVSEVTGNTVSFYGRAYDNYATTDNVHVFKINPITFKWNSLELKSTNTNPNTPLKISLSRNFNVSNFKNIGGMFSGLELSQCFGFNINLNSATNTAPVNTTNYAVLINNCQSFRYFGGLNRATRHAIALGGGGGDAAPPTRDGKIYGATLWAKDADTSGADMHGNVEYVVYDSCTTNFATFSGSNNTYQNCDIYERASQGCVLLSEPRGGVMNLINNRYYTTSALSSYAVIHSNIAQQLKEDLILNVIGGEVFGTGGATAQFISLRQSASLNEDLVKSVSVKINGVTSHLDQQAHWLRVQDAAAVRVMNTGYLIVDNIVNSKSTASPYLIHPSETTAVAKTRQMRQSGLVQMTSAVGTTVTRSSVVNLKYKYHKEPSVSVSIGNYFGQSAWDQLAFDDGTSSPQRTPSATNCFVSVSQVRPMVFWNKSVSTAKTFNLNWSCEVNDV